MNEYSPTPGLLPARMLNEFVYCPRLFHLEWVDQRWADNDDTAKGSYTHRSVDSRGGVVPLPEPAPAVTRTTYSVKLSDEALGLTAVIDRVEFGDGLACPVDHKSGHPAPDGSAWPPDRAQALAHAALLSAAGHHVEEARLFYAETRETVSVPWDPATADELWDLVAAARRQASALTPPAPLIDSPKCPRCSLVGLCMPDETNAMLLRSDRPPRRIISPDPDAQPLYVTEQGAYVSVKGGRLVVTVKREPIVDVRLFDVTHLCIFGHVQVTTEALTRLWAVDAAVLWMSYGGWLNGWASASPGKYVQLRRRQVLCMTDVGTIPARMIEGKIRNQRTLLRRNAKTPLSEAVPTSLASLAISAANAETTASLLGFEGTAARIYFANFAKMLGQGVAPAAMFDDHGRTRRPPTDPVNAVLSFCYALLVKDLVATCLAVGLDPYLGVLHSPRYGRPALALDLAEEFRPLVADSVVIQVFNNGEVGESDFIVRNAGCQLTAPGRRSVIAAYERRLGMQITHPLFGYRISYRRCMDVQARIFASVIIGELPEYVPLVTR